MAIKLWVNDELLDVTEDTNLTLKSASPIFETEIERGEYSFPFKIPLTQRNSRILNFPEQLTNLTESFVYNAELERLGAISTGVLYIDSTEFNHTLQQGYAECTFAGTDGKFLHLIDGKKMWQLEYGGAIAVPTYSPLTDPIIHSNAVAFATDITDGTITDQPFVFPMIKWDNFGLNASDIALLPGGFVNYWKKTPEYSTDTGDRFALSIGAEYYYRQRLIPMFKTKWIIEKIFEEYGFTVTGDFFNTAAFDADIIINSYSINKWQTDADVNPPYYAITDLCTEIYPANHLPDMLVTDFLNTICKRFNGQFMPTGPISYEFVLKTDIITTTASTEIPADKISPFIVKKLNETQEAQKGINLEYTEVDEAFSTRVIEGFDLSYIKGEVAAEADLAGIGSPAYNDIYLVLELNQFYKYNSLYWEFYCYNFINYKQFTDGNDISIDGAPLVNIFTEFSLISYGVGTIDYTINVPEIDAPGNYLGDEHINGATHGTIVGVQTSARTYLPLRFMLWYGMTDNEAADYEIPYCSGSNYDQTSAYNKVYLYNLAFYGPDGLYDTFYRAWHNILSNATKYEMQIYLGEHAVNALSFKEFITALEQKFLLYSRSFTEPYRNIASIEVYKIPYYIC